MSLTKDQIQARLTRATKVVEIPEWGESVTLYALSVKEDRQIKIEAAKVGVTEITLDQLRLAAISYERENGAEKLKEVLRGRVIDNTAMMDRPELLRDLGVIPLRTAEQAQQAEYANLLLLSYSIRDDKGNCMFTVPELEEMATVNQDGQRSDNVLEHLIAEAYDLNMYTHEAGFQAEAVEDFAKKS